MRGTQTFQRDPPLELPPILSDDVPPELLPELPPEGGVVVVPGLVSLSSGGVDGVDGVDGVASGAICAGGGVVPGPA